MKSKQMKIVIAALAALACALVVLPCTGYAASNPVTYGINTRLETHSKVRNAQSRNYGNDSYVSTTLSAFKKITPDYSGSLALVFKYGLQEKNDLSHIGVVSVTRKLTPDYSLTASYMALNSSQRDAAYRMNGLCQNVGGTWVCPESTSDLFSFNLKFKDSAKRKNSNTMAYSLAFNTATNFSKSRSLSPKIMYVTKMTKTDSVSISAQSIYTLNKTTRSNRRVTTNLFTMTFDRKLSKLSKVQLGIQYKDNKINRVPDDTKFYLSYNHMMISGGK